MTRINLIDKLRNIHERYTLKAVIIIAAGIMIFSENMPAYAQEYDIVIMNGRVMDPASNLDAIRNIGISEGKIVEITVRNITGRERIDASGLVAAPGFIDLHAHGQDLENNRFQVLDGVTSAFETEGGTLNVDRWYADREGKRILNYGVSVSHSSARRKAIGNRGSSTHLSATNEEIDSIKVYISRGLERGAVAVGLGIQYTPGASRWEILEIFRVAAKYNASCNVHIRYINMTEPGSSIEAVQEIISAAAISGAPLHVLHVHSTGLRQTPQILQMIEDAQNQGMDITAECYPYSAGQTSISSAVFDEGWQERLGISYSDLEMSATGERLTAESFFKYRQTGGTVIIHMIPQEIVDFAVTHPITMIASDGRMSNGRGHPRGTGTFSRVLGVYVREKQALTLMDALRKMTLMPAMRLEKRVPTMKNKGRLKTGADADITVFDPDRVIDRSTYKDPALAPAGIKFVIINGMVVVKNGSLLPDIFPGKAIRAPVTND